LTALYWLALAVVAIVLGHALIGWHLANGLRDGILEVHPRPTESPVRVREVSDGLIMLEASEPCQDLGHPGVLGLAWDGGYGRLGEVVQARDGRITRRFEMGTGEPPLCTGPLEGCPPVILDSFTFPEGPGDVDLEYQTVTYPSELGPMDAWWVPAASGRRWAVMCHGWTTERRELVRMLPSFHRRGWSALVIDYRNDPGMPADPSGRYRFGLSEWHDLESAVRHAESLGADEIVLMGCSTGGALIMAFLEHSEHSESIAGVVLDSPNLVLADTVRQGTTDMKATRLMLEMGMWIADLRWKIDWEATNYVQRAERYLHIPTLVFHGTSDQTVPIAESRQLEAAVPSLVDLVETPAAGHVRSWNADPERYETYLERFLDLL
jgi:alpha-beta hydrolase superfamily lysophospholipase